MMGARFSDNCFYDSFLGTLSCAGWPAALERGMKVVELQIACPDGECPKKSDVQRSVVEMEKLLDSKS